MAISVLASLRVNHPATSDSLSMPTAIEKLGDHNGIAVVMIYGPISNSEATSFLSTGGASDEIVDEINGHKDDPNVRALILRINSPGGTVGAAQEISDAVQRFKSARPKVPVLASIGDQGASAAYWIACSADTIVANPGSLVGSIGVIMQQLDLTSVKDKYGVGVRTYKSGDYKDMMSGWRTPSSGEEVIVQSMLDNVHEQFLEMVQNHRKLSPQQMALVQEAQIFTGKQAIAVGLVDQLGSFQKTVDIATRQAKIKSPYLIERPRNPFATFLSQMGIASHLPIPVLTPSFPVPQ